MSRSSRENGGSVAILWAANTVKSRSDLLTWYWPSTLTKNRRRRSGETSSAMLSGYRPARALVIDATFASVANNWIATSSPPPFAVSRNSVSAIRIEYASSPVAHPGVQIRWGCGAVLHEAGKSTIIAGRRLVRKIGSRYEEIALQACTSSGCWRRWRA